MKMHCAVVVEVLSALTAAWTVLYFPEPPTARQPDGGELRAARASIGEATAAAAAVRTRATDGSMLTTFWKVRRCTGTWRTRKIETHTITRRCLYSQETAYTNHLCIHRLRYSRSILSVSGCNWLWDYPGRVSWFPPTVVKQKTRGNQASHKPPVARSSLI